MCAKKSFFGGDGEGSQFFEPPVFGIGVCVCNPSGPTGRSTTCGRHPSCSKYAFSIVTKEEFFLESDQGRTVSTSSKTSLAQPPSVKPPIGENPAGEVDAYFNEVVVNRKVHAETARRVVSAINFGFREANRTRFAPPFAPCLPTSSKTSLA